MYVGPGFLKLEVKSIVRPIFTDDSIEPLTIIFHCQTDFLEKISKNLICI